MFPRLDKISTLKVNLFSNYVSNIIIAVLGIIFVPIYLRYLGAETYGLIGVFISLQVMLSVLDGGLGTALTKEIAYRISQINSPENRIGNLVKSLGTVYWVIAIAIGIIAIALSPLIASYWVKPVTLTYSDIVTAFMLLGLNLNIFAETITLNSGKKIDGKIIEKTDDHVKIDVGGQVMYVPFRNMKSESAQRLKALPAINLPAATPEAPLVQEPVTPPKISVDKKDSKKHFEEARSLFSKGQKDAAIKEFQQATLVNPSDWSAWLNLGLIYDSDKKWPAAIEAYQKTTEIKPDFAIAWYKLAVSYFNSGDNKKAAETYQKAKALGPNPDKVTSEIIEKNADKFKL